VDGEDGARASASRSRLTSAAAVFCLFLSATASRSLTSVDQWLQVISIAEALNSNFNGAFYMKETDVQEESIAYDEGPCVTNP
jgi:hypothetical protein